MLVTTGTGIIIRIDFNFPIYLYTNKYDVIYLNSLFTLNDIYNEFQL